MWFVPTSSSLNLRVGQLTQSKASSSKIGSPILDLGGCGDRYLSLVRAVNICIVETLRIFLVNASSLLLVKGRNISFVKAVDMIAIVLVFPSSYPPDNLVFCSGPLKE